MTRTIEEDRAMQRSERSVGRTTVYEPSKSDRPIVERVVRREGGRDWGNGRLTTEKKP